MTSERKCVKIDCGAESCSPTIAKSIFVTPFKNVPEKPIWRKYLMKEEGGALLHPRLLQHVHRTVRLDYWRWNPELHGIKWEGFEGLKGKGIFLLSLLIFCLVFLILKEPCEKVIRGGELQREEGPFTLVAKPGCLQQTFVHGSPIWI